MTTSNRELTDEQLMAEVQQGRQWALHSLYDRFVNRVYGMALPKLGDPAEAQDVTHDVFVNLWQSYGVFRPDGGSLANWLLTVAHNRINDRSRHIRRAAGSHEDVSHNPSSEPEASKGSEDLQSLPDEQREVVVLSYYRGYSQAEISQRLDVPLATVGTRMRLALAGLRELSNARWNR